MNHVREIINQTVVFIEEQKLTGEEDSVKSQRSEDELLRVQLNNRVKINGKNRRKSESIKRAPDFLLLTFTF